MDKQVEQHESKQDVFEAVMRDYDEVFGCAVGHGYYGDALTAGEYRTRYAAAANETGGHVVPLAELEPVEVSEEEAEILRMAKTSGHPYGYIYAHTHTVVNEDRLMRAYVNGWTVEKPKRWIVKVPHTDDSYFYKIDDEYCNAGDSYHLEGMTDKKWFTLAEIEHYGLQDYEKVEVKD